MNNALPFARGAVLCAALALVAGAARTESPPLPDEAARSNPPPIVRVAPKNVRMPLEPADTRYRTDYVFRSLKFSEPVEIVFAPGETNRFFVVEKPGRIIAVENLTQPESSVFLDITDRVFHEQESGLLGLAFHPNFAENGRFYVFYTHSTSGNFAGIHMRLAQFQVAPDRPGVASPDSEVLLFSQHDGDPWHQAGNLKFGLDGYLYVSVGDGGASGGDNAQRIDGGLFSGILRLDVDNRPGSLIPNPPYGRNPKYWIPPDNPFVGATHFNGFPVEPDRVRTEFYAVGLRNPWRFAFDPYTGLLYSNDTGEARREEINLIFKGENYGWNYFEGTLENPNRQLPAPADTLFHGPVAEYGYDSGEPGSGKAIAAATLYRGDRFPELNGAFLFSDFWTGEIGKVDFSGSNLLFDIWKLHAQIQQLEQHIAALVEDLDKSQAIWEQSQLEAETNWSVIEPEQFSSTSGATLTMERDRSIRAQGTLSWTDIYTVHATTKLTDIQAVRLELLTDSTLPELGPGRSAGGNVVLSGFELYAAPQADPENLQRIELDSAKADFEQPGFGIAGALDTDQATGWAIAPAVSKPHEAVIAVAKPFGFSNGTRLMFILRQEFGLSTSIGRFRLSITPQKNVSPNPLPFLNQIVRTPASQRTPAEQRQLAYHYRSIDPKIQSITDQITALRRERFELLRRRPSSIEWIAWRPGVASFTIDPNSGDLLMPDMLQGLVHRLLPPDTSNPDLQIPRTLAETGLFSDPVHLVPAPGVVPYEINAPFWSDGALKTRWFAMPDLESKIGFDPVKNWTLPTGMLWIKHFELPVSTDGQSRKIETRVLVRNRLGVHGVTYRWDADQKTATLVPPEGLTETISLGDGTPQRWRFPSRSECVQCHTTEGGFALGFNTAQMNRNVHQPGAIGNQLVALSAAGYFDKEIVHTQDFPALARLDDEEVSREYRVRSYFASNCSYCHQPGGSGRSLWDGRISTPLDQASIINAALSHASADADDRLVKSGDPDRSLLWKRLAFLDARRMPPIGVRRPDTAAVGLVKSWIIEDLPKKKSFAEWQRDFFDNTDPIRAHPAYDADNDGTVNYVEYLTGRDPRDPSETWRLDIQSHDSGVELRFVRPPNQPLKIETTTNLFDSSSWQPLVHPENRPIYAAREQPVTIELPLSQPTTFYRVRFLAE